MQITIDAGRVTATPETAHDLMMLLTPTAERRVASISPVSAITSENQCPKCHKVFKSPMGLKVHMTHMKHNK